jgi:hypothetical protein
MRRRAVSTLAAIVLAIGAIVWVGTTVTSAPVVNGFAYIIGAPAPVTNTCSQEMALACDKILESAKGDLMPHMAFVIIKFLNPLV